MGRSALMQNPPPVKRRDEGWSKDCLRETLGEGLPFTTQATVDEGANASLNGVTDFGLSDRCVTPILDHSVYSATIRSAQDTASA